MAGVLLNLTAAEVKLLRKHGFNYEADCNKQLVSKKTATIIRSTINRILRKEDGNVFHA